jgi:CubicO group peptidase (beta-lactamase class C family)
MGDANGWTAAGFEGVRAAFAENFAAGLEIGASFAAYWRGEKVADLWGGIADPASGRTWDEHTLALVFSTTKGIAAICANKLADEGALDVDAPVARYWPEFAVAGKGDLPVSYVLSHRAGLAWLEGDLTADDAFAGQPVVEALAAQVPHWEPGTRHGYHATTYGWLVGEIVRRITGASIGTYFRREIAEPLGLDFWIGLPESEEPRVATLVGGLADEALIHNEEVRALFNEFMGPHTILGRALFSPSYSLSEPGVWNSRALHAAEVAAAGGIGDARSLARVYAACIGEVDGIRLLSAEQVAKATKQQTSGPDMTLLDMDIQYGLGFQLPSTVIALGGPRSFGHFGAGGSVGWADPDADLAFGYVMNKMDLGLAGDVRSTRLVQACYDAVRAAR